MKCWPSVIDDERKRVVFNNCWESKIRCVSFNIIPEIGIVTPKRFGHSPSPATRHCSKRLEGVLGWKCVFKWRDWNEKDREVGSLAVKLTDEAWFMKPSVLFVSRSCHERAIPARAFSRNVRETQEGESVGLPLLPATTRRARSSVVASGVCYVSYFANDCSYRWWG